VIAGRAFALLALAIAVGACEQAERREAQDGEGPLATARALLALHDLQGRQPEERTKESVEKEVDREALAGLVEDLEGRDGFITDVYLGFVLGSLARNQTRLSAAREGTRAVIRAGKAAVVLDLAGGRWKVDLEASVPEEIKRRAIEEKKSYEEAKANAATAIP